MFLKGGKGAGAPDKGGGAFSYIGSEVVVTGDIATQSELHVDGRVIGDVRCGVLSQGPSGEVRGNIKAVEARLAGLVDGAVEAGILVLEASARVTGDVLYESLSIAAGAEVEGRFRRRREGEEASKPPKGGRSKADKAAPAPAAATPLFGAAEETAEAAE